MYHNGCSVRIVGGREQDNGYVAMAHKQEYKLCLRNEKDLPCDAEVRIDGKDVGTWRIEPHTSITLERPAHDNGKLTFYEVDTAEGRAANLQSGDSNLGLISVTFKHGYVCTARPLTVNPTYPNWYYTTWTTGNTTWTAASPDSLTDNTVHCYSASSNFAGTVMTESPKKAGGTGLSGHSNQYFYTVAPLGYTQYPVTIHLRLVGVEVRPLEPCSTPVPPPIG